MTPANWGPAEVSFGNIPLGFDGQMLVVAPEISCRVPHLTYCLQPPVAGIAGTQPDLRQHRLTLAGVRR